MPTPSPSPNPDTLTPAILTGRQRRHLRSLANCLKATVWVGHDGVTSELVAQVTVELDRHELVKLTINRNYDGATDTIAHRVAAAIPAHWVQTVGRTVVLYRAADPPDIRLPEAPQ